MVRWVDVFTRGEYKDVIVDSLNYCIQQKGLELNAWVLMTNHLNLVGRVSTDLGMSGFLRDFKKFTSKRILELIQEIPESRREWLLNRFNFEAKRTRRAENFKFWKDGNHAIDLQHIDAFNKINYAHLNPLRARIINEPDHYIYSSAIDYANGKGLVQVTLL